MVHRCLIDGSELRVRHGTVVVASRGDHNDLDWEAVIDAADDPAVELGRNELQLTVIVGVDDAGSVELAELSGEAQVVRYVQSTVVWRGDGALTGFDRGRLS